jgi:CheY-like chemotaxis protein
MINQMVILGILEKMGHMAVAVPNGREAVKMLKSIPYDLVLMDIQMPEMDGLEATRLIRKMEAERSNERDQRSAVRDQKEADSVSHQPFLRIPILALSAHTMAEEIETSLAAGMDGYITKPVSRQSVADAINKIAYLFEQPGPDAVVSAPALERSARNAHPGTAKPVARRNGAERDAQSGDQFAGPVVVFDSKAFADRLSGDTALMREVINTFLEETPKIMRALEKAILKEQKEGATRLAHKLKGSAAAVGGNQLHAVADRIEIACNLSSWKEAAAMIPRLNKQYEFLERFMREYLQKPNGA